MESRDRFVDTMLREEMRRLNAHLPKSRQLLSELLLEESPSVPTVDGGKIIMKRSELEEFASTLPEEVKDRVRLPLVLFRRTELGAGAFTVMGDVAEEFALSKIMKGYEGTFEEFRRNRGKEHLLYKPDVSELMRRFHTLLVIGFGVPDDARTRAGQYPTD